MMVIISYWRISFWLTSREAICQIRTSVHRIVRSGGAVSEFGAHKQAGRDASTHQLTYLPPLHVKYVCRQLHARCTSKGSWSMWT